MPRQVHHLAGVVQIHGPSRNTRRKEHPNMPHEHTSTTGRWTLTWHQETVDVVTNLPEPDPNWRYTDAAGHEHRAATDERGYVTHPTLAAMLATDEDGDTYVDHLECPACYEHIVPGAIYNEGIVRHMPGQMSAELHGRDVRGVETHIVFLTQAALEHLAQLVTAVPRDNPAARDAVIDEWFAAGPDGIAVTSTFNTSGR